MNFDGFMQALERLGVADVLLPFVLVFTVIFAIMQKTEILGKGKKNINTMIALVMGLAVVFPHSLHLYAEESDPVNIINKALPNVSVVLIAVVMLLLLIGLLGGEIKWLGTSISGWIAIISFIIILIIFGRAAGWFMYGWPHWLWWLDPSTSPDTASVIIILLVFGIIIWFITKDDSTKGTRALGGFMEDIGKLFMKK